MRAKTLIWQNKNFIGLAGNLSPKERRLTAGLNWLKGSLLQVTKKSAQNPTNEACYVQNWKLSTTENEKCPRTRFSLSRAYSSKPARYSACLTTILRFLPRQICLILPLFMRARWHTECLYKSQATKPYLHAFITTPSFLKHDCFMLAWSM